MFTATLEAPIRSIDPLAAMLAEIDAGAAPSVLKYDSKKPPNVDAPHLKDICRRLPDLRIHLKNTEAELDSMKKDLRDFAAPHLLSFSRKFGQHVKTVKVNGISVQCRPPHYTACLKGAARQREASQIFGPLFPRAFELQYVIPATPGVIAALKAAGEAYEVQCKPTEWLHHARSTDPAIETMLAHFSEIRPIYAVTGG